MTSNKTWARKTINPQIDEQMSHCCRPKPLWLNTLHNPSRHTHARTFLLKSCWLLLNQKKACKIGSKAYTLYKHARGFQQQQQHQQQICVLVCVYPYTLYARTHVRTYTLRLNSTRSHSSNNSHNRATATERQLNNHLSDKQASSSSCLCKYQLALAVCYLKQISQSVTPLTCQNLHLIRADLIASLGGRSSM